MKQTSKQEKAYEINVSCHLCSRDNFPLRAETAPGSCVIFTVCSMHNAMKALYVFVCCSDHLNYSWYTLEAIPYL
jgi:predicted transcriptional regulator